MGRFKLLEKLGEGGFGSVWAAEQREPVRRRVALKIIKLGMDTKQVVARFEAERQALALMDHPNIAKVLDAGTTETGRPYFVMELVKGIPITKYFEQEGTEVTEKLGLFIRVCQAIQHAHQKGIIHRDIKPSNVMVTLHDGEPVPKVIDFGIEKATQGDLTDKTIYTQYTQFIGTPAYMSPEQAEMSGLDVDTRSDIYSLGVLLYELLAGATPFDARELMQSGIDEMRRIIREQEPVRPSTKLSQTLSAEMVAGKASPIHDSSCIDRDLDWIVLKCLEKDRSRRYDSATGLAADIQRHLDNKPVQACPSSVLYQFQKMWRRNRVAFVGACAVALSLSVGLMVSVWQGYQKTIESRAKDVAIKGQEEALILAQESKTKAENSAEEARGNLYAADPAIS
ncbi:serine/threonine protein kinase [bacterium]|nr:serine/threonine protein kinase [bacterium]